MGFLDSFLDMADKAVRTLDVVSQKIERMQEFENELNALSDLEVQWFYYTCIGVMKKRDIKPLLDYSDLENS